MKQVWWVSPIQLGLTIDPGGGCSFVAMWLATPRDLYVSRSQNSTATIETFVSGSEVAVTHPVEALDYEKFDKFRFRDRRYWWGPTLGR